MSLEFLFGCLGEGYFEKVKVVNGVHEEEPSDMMRMMIVIIIIIIINVYPF